MTIFPEQAVKELDREVENHYTLIVKATEDCLSLPPPISFFNPADDTLLRVHIYVNDINDNPPKFTREVFTGGITTASDFGLEIMRLMVRTSTYCTLSMPVVHIVKNISMFNMCLMN